MLIEVLFLLKLFTLVLGVHSYGLANSMGKDISSY
jgi:hypothetical protein